MRIGLITGEYPPDVGGVGDQTSRLAGELAARGQLVQVVTTARPGQVCTVWPAHARDDERPGAVEVLPVVRRWDWSILGLLPRLAQRGAWDVLHLQYQPGAYQLHGAITCLPGWLRLAQRTIGRGRPVAITTFHDLRVPYLFPKAGRLRQLAVRHLARSCDGIVTAEPVDRRQLVSWTRSRRPPPAIEQIPLGNVFDLPPPATFDRAAWRAGLGVPPGATLAGHFGFVNRGKAIDSLVAAVATLVARERDLHLVMIGDPLGTTDATNAGYHDAIRQQVSSLGLASRVHWTGHCQPADVAGWLRCLDIAVLPFQDGASLRRTSIIAAWAHGVPVVTTSPAAGAEWLTTPPAAVTVPTGSGGDLAAPLALAIEAVLDDHVLRRSLATAGSDYARRFAWNTVAEATLALYRQVMSTTTPGTPGHPGRSRRQDRLTPARSKSAPQV